MGESRSRFGAAGERGGKASRQLSGGPTSKTTRRGTRSSGVGAHLAQREDEARDGTVWDERDEVEKTRSSTGGTTRRASSRTNGTRLAPPPRPEGPATTSRPAKALSKPRSDERPPTASRRSSTRLSASLAATTTAAEEEEDRTASPPPRKRPRTSARSRDQPLTKGDDADEIPEPFDYVPLAERLKKEPGENKARKAVSPAGAERPPLRATRSGRVVGLEEKGPAVATVPGPSSAPKDPAPPPARQPPRPRTPPASAVSRTDVPNVALPTRPPSPAKDLSALFSRFAPPPTSTLAPTSGRADARAQSPQRMGVKRTMSLGGVVGSLKAGQRKIAVEDASEEEAAGASASGRFTRPSNQVLTLTSCMLLRQSHLRRHARRSTARSRSPTCLPPRLPRQLARHPARPSPHRSPSHILAVPRSAKRVPLPSAGLARPPDSRPPIQPSSAQDHPLSAAPTGLSRSLLPRPQRSACWARPQAEAEQVVRPARTPAARARSARTRPKKTSSRRLQGQLCRASRPARRPRPRRLLLPR